MSEHQGEKLKEYLGSAKDPTGKRRPLEEIARDLGVSRSTLYYQFNKVRLDLDFVELLNRSGFKFNPDSPHRAPSDAIPANGPHKGGNIIYVPLVAYGGFMHGYANKVFMDSLERFSLPGIHGEHYAFEVQGSSMVPLAHPGDVVIARKEEQLEWMVRGRTYVLQTIDGIIVKLFDSIADGKAHFRSADKANPSHSISLKSIKGVYQVVKVLKDFNTMPE